MDNSSGSELTTIQILRKAKSLIADPANWIKGEYQRNAEGEAEYFPMEEAVCFCASGALAAAVFLLDPSYEAPIEMSYIWGSALGCLEMGCSHVENLKDFRHVSVEDFNDAEDTTHDMVMAAFAWAIKIEEESNESTSST